MRCNKSFSIGLYRTGDNKGCETWRKALLVGYHDVFWNGPFQTKKQIDEVAQNACSVSAVGI